MANDRNLEKNIISARNLHVLFQDIQRSPDLFLFVPDLVENLSTQITMGKIHIPERSIFPCSMSTIKRIANKHFLGGFAALDKQRALAYLSLKKAQSPSKPHEQTKEGLRAGARERKREIQTLRQDLFLRDAVIFSLARLLMVCAKELESPPRTEFFIKARAQELYRLGYKGSNIDER
jgi:hypothetical protein